MRHQHRLTLQLRSVEKFRLLEGGAFCRLTMQSYNTPKARFMFLSFFNFAKLAEKPDKYGGCEDIKFFVFFLKTR